MRACKRTPGFDPMALEEGSDVLARCLVEFEEFRHGSALMLFILPMASYFMAGILHLVCLFVCLFVCLLACFAGLLL